MSKIIWKKLQKGDITKKGDYWYIAEPTVDNATNHNYIELYDRYFGIAIHNNETKDGYCVVRPIGIELDDSDIISRVEETDRKLDPNL